MVYCLNWIHLITLSSCCQSERHCFPQVQEVGYAAAVTVTVRFEIYLSFKRYTYCMCSPVPVPRCKDDGYPKLDTVLCWYCMFMCHCSLLHLVYLCICWYDFSMFVWCIWFWFHPTCFICYTWCFPLVQYPEIWQRCRVIELGTNVYVLVQAPPTSHLSILYCTVQYQYIMSIYSIRYSSLWVVTLCCLGWVVMCHTWVKRKVNVSDNSLLKP